MKKVQAFANVLVVVLFVLAALPVAARADVITIAADEWCPYNCVPDSDTPGYMIEIAKAVFEPKGHTVQYVTVNWSRAVDSCRKGKYTAVVGAAKGDAPDFIFPEIDQGMIQNAFFVKKGTNWKYTDVNSLKNVKIGVIQDYDYGSRIGPYLEQNKSGSSVQFATGDDALERNIKKAGIGRIDAILEDVNVFKLKAKEMGKAGEFVIAGYDKGPEKENKIFIAFSPADANSRSYAEMLGKGTEALRQSGELEKILEKYGLTDWQ